MRDPSSHVAERWQSLDPLLAAPLPLSADDDVLRVPGGLGVRSTVAPEPDLPLPMWAAAHQFSLRPLVEDAAALDRLLTVWHQSVATATHEAGPDSAAYVSVPSRDIELFPALARHGLAPYVVVAIRLAGVPREVPRSVDGVLVRRAVYADLPALVEITLRHSALEQRFLASYDRADAATQVAGELMQLLDTAEPWVWLAEAGERLVGVLTVSPPTESEWLSRFTSVGPTAYLASAYVDDAYRGTGVGAALTRMALAAVDASGVRATLLHYALLNPYAGPFWHRMGFRPLWTGWQAYPAATLR